MTVLPTLFANQPHGESPLHEQLVRTLREAILAGHLPLHGRLPASRTLARDLGVSRGTVELAYGRLGAEGYLVRKVGAGSCVALASPAVARRWPTGGPATTCPRWAAPLPPASRIPASSPRRSGAD